MSVNVQPRTLLRAYQDGGDTSARDALVEAHMPLVWSIARRYAGRGEYLDDLVQVGSIGLIKAIDRFDLSREVEFTTYAIPTIVGEIKRHFRDRVWLVTVPRRLKELYFRLPRIMQTLTADLGRSPTYAELAAAAGVDEEAVIEAMAVGRAYSTRSLAGGSADGDGSAADPLELIPEVDGAFEVSEDRVVLAAGLQALEPRERLIVHMRFFAGMTQSQIAAEIGISQMHVSRLIRKSLDTLQDEIEEV